MSDNYGRTHLVTNFTCAECGTPLNLSYRDDAKKAKYYNDNITGADKVEQHVYVEPCYICMKPARDILEAVKILQGSMDGSN